MDRDGFFECDRRLMVKPILLYLQGKENIDKAISFAVFKINFRLMDFRSSTVAQIVHHKFDKIYIKTSDILYTDKR